MSFQVIRSSISNYSNLQKLAPICFINNVRNVGLTQHHLCKTAENPLVENAESEKVENDTQEQLNKLLEEKGVLNKELQSFKDKYQRALADRENLRVRLERQILDAKQFGIQSFCKDLLEVSDVFRKAIESVPEEEIKTSSCVIQNLFDGVVMTEKQLLSVFKRHGLDLVVPSIGDKFDSTFQEAMFEVESQDQPKGTVAHIIRSGWKLHERCIRSAQVGVVKD